MKVRFWGVRGSIPTPVSPEQIQAKINAVVQRIKPEDLESADSRERFLAGLPAWLYGTVGGNTPCVQLVTKDGKEMILDAGSGIRELGKKAVLPKDMHYDIFFSHFHWDHIQGLPFFDAAYNPEVSFDFYSPVEDAREILSNQMQKSYYPVGFDSFTRKIDFHYVHPGTGFSVSGLSVNSCRLKHPGDSYAYSFIEDGKKFVYATDVELIDFTQIEDENVHKVFYGADAVVLDSQYTIEEAFRKENWGHSAFCYAIDFAAKMNIKSVYLFHHEPTYNDKKINSLLQAAKWYSDYISHSRISIHLAVEGLEFEV